MTLSTDVKAPLSTPIYRLFVDEGQEPPALPEGSKVVYPAGELEGFAGVILYTGEDASGEVALDGEIDLVLSGYKAAKHYLGLLESISEEQAWALAACFPEQQDGEKMIRICTQEPIYASLDDGIDFSREMRSELLATVSDYHQAGLRLNLTQAIIYAAEDIGVEQVRQILEYQVAGLDLTIFEATVFSRASFSPEQIQQAIAQFGGVPEAVVALGLAGGPEGLYAWSEDSQWVQIVRSYYWRIHETAKGVFETELLVEENPFDQNDWLGDAELMGLASAELDSLEEAIAWIGDKTGVGAGEVDLNDTDIVGRSDEVNSWRGYISMGKTEDDPRLAVR